MNRFTSPGHEWRHAKVLHPQLGNYCFFFLFVSSVALGRPSPYLLGVPRDELGDAPLSEAWLRRAEEQLPDRYYQFDWSGEMERLDKSSFDPYLDTHPFKNKSNASNPGGSCFGLSAQVVESYSRWAKAQFGGEGDSTGGSSDVSSRGGARLRQVASSKKGAASILRRANEVHWSQRKITGVPPVSRILFEEMLLPDLQNPLRGATALSLLIRDMNGVLYFPHSVVVYRIERGEAVSTQVLVENRNLNSRKREKLREIQSGLEEHRVPVIRIDFWDSNFPFASRGETRDPKKLPQLFYFPKSGRFGLPRNNWYKEMEADQFRTRFEGKGGFSAHEAEQRKKSKTLLQRLPTHLSGEIEMHFPDIHSVAVREARDRFFEHYGSAFDPQRRLYGRSYALVDKRRAQMISEADHSRGKGNGESSNYYWERREIIRPSDVVERLIDDHLLDAYGFDENSSQEVSRAVH